MDQNISSAMFESANKHSFCAQPKNVLVYLVNERWALWAFDCTWWNTCWNIPLRMKLLQGCPQLVIDNYCRFLPKFWSFWVDPISPFCVWGFVANLSSSHRSVNELWPITVRRKSSPGAGCHLGVWDASPTKMGKLGGIKNDLPFGYLWMKESNWVKSLIIGIDEWLTGLSTEVHEYNYQQKGKHKQKHSNIYQMLCKQCGKSNIEPPILEGLLNTPFLVKGLLNVTVSGLFPFGALDNFDPVTDDETLWKTRRYRGCRILSPRKSWGWGNL